MRRVRSRRCIWWTPCSTCSLSWWSSGVSITLNWTRAWWTRAWKTSQSTLQLLLRVWDLEKYTKCKRSHIQRTVFSLRCVFCVNAFIKCSFKCPLKLQLLLETLQHYSYNHIIIHIDQLITYSVTSHCPTDLSPVVLAELVVRLCSTRLKLVIADAIFRNLCCKNGLTIAEEPLSLKKMVCTCVLFLFNVLECITGKLHFFQVTHIHKTRDTFLFFHVHLIR